jgi:DNA mismatch repair protein MutL
MGPQSLGIKSAPAFLKESSITKALDKMAVDITTHGHLYSFESSVGDIIATMACHSSVRAGQSLSIIEMRELLHLMDEFPLSSYCPHGRPVMIEQSFQKIETDFGRRGS